MTLGLHLLRVIAVVAVMGACFAGWRATAATADAQLAQAQAASIASRLVEIQRLRPQQQTALLASRPTESVSASVRTALAAIGLGDTTLKSVNPGADEAVQGAEDTGASYRRQNVTVSLTPLTSRHLGQFLAAWRAAEPAWIVVRIDLSHQGPETETTYEARLTFATTYVVSPVTSPAISPAISPVTLHVTLPERS